jgi:hypothetical protein
VAQVGGRVRVSKRLTGSDHQLFVLTERDLPARAAGAALVLQRTAATHLLGDPCGPHTFLRGRDRRGVPGRTGDRPSGRVDPEITLADTTLNHRAVGDGGEHLHVALSQL